MEIPSSSPVYSPLKPENAGEFAVEQVELFPKNENSPLKDDNTNTTHDNEHNATNRYLDDSEDDYTKEYRYEHNNGEDELNGNQFYPNDPHDETIFSDSDFEVPDTDSQGDATDDEKEEKEATQNLIDALLTESVLESLPLPQDKLDTIRKLRPK